MLEFAEVAVRIVQILLLTAILMVFALVPLIGLYLWSDGVRETVQDFESWAARRRIKRKLKDAFKNNDPRTFATVVSPNEYRLMHGYTAAGTHHSLYDAVASYHMFDPLDDQSSKDTETLNRATEYSNDLNG